MAKVQAKLKECVDKQSLKSLDHLSAQLATDTMAADEPDIMQVPVEASPVKGENKAPIVGKKKSKRKHKLKSAAKKESEKMQGVSKEKRRPRFFCQF